MRPEVSVIIPTYNRYSLLGETLDSILAQTYTEWECIVIDDGSDDYTAELMEFYLQKDSRFSFYKRPNQKLKGANACRNYGFELSKGTYINWFDSDDLMDPKKLELQLEHLKKSAYSFCICQTTGFNENISSPDGLRFENIQSENYFYDYLSMKIGWLTQAPLWKRPFLQKMDILFDEELHAAQEWEFHLRVLYKVRGYAIIDKPLVYLRKHSKGITYSNEENTRVWNYFLARLKIYKNKSLDLDKESRIFLQNYLLNSFKNMIVTRNKYSFLAFKKFVRNENLFSVKAKINALLALISFKLFNRGNVFLQKIKFNLKN